MVCLPLAECFRHDEKGGAARQCPAYRNDILIQIRRRAALDAMYVACSKTAYRVVLKKDMEQMKAYTQCGGFAGGCHLLGGGIGYGVDLR